MQLRHVALLFGALLFGAPAALAGGCSSASDNAVDDPGLGDGGGTRDGANGGDTICLLNNCDTNRECADCSNGRTTCDQKAHRCIACGPAANGASCTGGKECTQYGECVTAGLTCPLDQSGTPTISCAKSDDCSACDPQHRVCDTGTKKCVGCLPTDVTYCQSTDACVGNACKPKCPDTCNADGDCSQCGAPGKEAHACNAHKCAQCSPTSAKCANGGTCDEHGVCKPPCGKTINGRKDACTSSADCAGCEATKTCDLPINGGTGTCRVGANGCSDLVGKGIFVLPDPFSRYTNLCSSDPDCANVEAEFNVGKALRDVTGLDLIKDANVPYAMHACASVTIIGDKSCGVCVPCKKDTDCADIDVTSVVGQAFGPLGSIGASILLDKAFGPNDHKVHMYCDEVTNGYGVCVPCPNILSSCAQGVPIPPGGTCTHDVCASGDPMGAQCNQCTGEVCAKDSFCCTNRWDDQCVREVDQYCSLVTCAPPDTCTYKTPNWYCSTLQTYAAYHCEGDPIHITEGQQCLQNQYCHRTGPGPKAPAILDANGRPQCFNTP